ncbi:MAG: 23S rRNA (uridine(2552)-2'-O)-methyltransferase RlmE [Pseudomonadota bacterium]
MAKKKSSSKAWLREHQNDAFVQMAQKEGYRSRACYKLLELNERDRLFRSGMTVVDLGSAPGGWSQIAADKVGAAGDVIATDILPMDSIAGVTFFQGDFTEEEVFSSICEHLGEIKPDLVISDMAPNLSGMKDIDQPRGIHLVELALDFALNNLRPQGDFVAKVFQGEGFDDVLGAARRAFGKVHIRKPEASRSRSREVYLVAKGLS